MRSEYRNLAHFVAVWKWTTASLTRIAKKQSAILVTKRNLIIALVTATVCLAGDQHIYNPYRYAIEFNFINYIYIILCPKLDRWKSIEDEISQAFLSAYTYASLTHQTFWILAPYNIRFSLILKKISLMPLIFFNV